MKKAMFLIVIILLVSTTNLLSLEKTFTWQYKSINYSITLKLDKKIYQHYQSKKNRPAWHHNCSPDDYKYYQYTYKKDTIIKAINAQIATIAQYQGLSNDEIVELTTCFVRQCIVYDKAKAETESFAISFPYETLWEGKEICNGKSILLLNLLKDQGYTVFYILWNGHISIAIPSKHGGQFYRNLQYIETTGFNNKEEMPCREVKMAEGNKYYSGDFTIFEKHQREEEMNSYIKKCAIWTNN